MYGNNHNIKIFVRLPREFETFFKNTFYASFSTSDLEDTDINPFLNSTWRILEKKHIVFKRKAELNDKSFFTKDGSYMDPMIDILDLFGNVASTDNLTIEFKYRFK